MHPTVSILAHLEPIVKNLTLALPEKNTINHLTFSF
jgi:hypothetical protein